jgi:hypothetical protein
MVLLPDLRCQVYPIPLALCNTISCRGESPGQSSVFDPLYNKCAYAVPYSHVEDQEQPVEFETNFFRWAGAPRQIKLKRETMRKGIRNAPDHIGPPKFARGVEQDDSKKDFPEIGFEKASHRAFEMNYTRNRIATPRMARIVPATACQPSFSLNTK